MGSKKPAGAGILLGLHLHVFLKSSGGCTIQFLSEIPKVLIGHCEIVLPVHAVKKNMHCCVTRLLVYHPAFWYMISNIKNEYAQAGIREKMKQE